MKNKREAWNFVELPYIPKLSRLDRRYWRDYLPKVLKIGVEVEFNLPEQKGSSCMGLTGRICTCSQFSDCSQKVICALHPKMSSSPFRGNNKCNMPYNLVCKEYAGGKCGKNIDIENCTSDCPHFRFACGAEDCLYFVSGCWSCEAIGMMCRDCSERFNETNDPECIRDKIRDKLRPTGRVDLAGKSGTFDVTTDGSLRGGGLELISTGRRPTFHTLYAMVKGMLDSAKEQGAYIDERCGIHMHLLTGYYQMSGNKYFANELERPMPQVILANLHQLVRRYQAALVWITSCLETKEAMTRWEKFRIGIQDLSPMEMSMSELKKVQYERCCNYGNGKYGFLSYSGKKLAERTKFNSNGDIEIFHVEFRAPDACWNPLAIASWAYLIYAALIRAVDLSVYGVMEYAQSPEEAARIEREYKALCNNCPTNWDGPRTSDTSGAHKHFEKYIEDSENLLEILKPTLLKEEPIFGILKDLAMKPISIRRIGGESFGDIEATMEKYVPKYHGDELLTKIDDSINLSMFTDCSSVKEWVEHTIDEIIKPKKKDRESVSKKIHEYIKGEIEADNLIWNATTGTLVTRR